MSTPIPMSIPTSKSPEEIRVEMRARFDAVNKVAQEQWERRHVTGERTTAEKDSQQVKPEAAAAGIGGLGENDSLGG